MFKINFTGIDRNLNKILKSVDKYNKKANQILNGINWLNLTRKIRKVVKNEMKSAGFNERGDRSKAIINLFGVSKGDVKQSPKGRVRTFTIRKPQDYPSRVFVKPNVSWYSGIKRPVNVAMVVNFMQFGRGAYQIPGNDHGTGFNVLRWKKPSGKLGCYNHISNGPVTVPKYKGDKADFDGEIWHELNDWLVDISVRMANEQTDLINGVT